MQPVLHTYFRKYFLLKDNTYIHSTSLRDIKMLSSSHLVVLHVLLPLAFSLNSYLRDLSINVHMNLFSSNRCI